MPLCVCVLAHLRSPVVLIEKLVYSGALALALKHTNTNFGGVNAVVELDSGYHTIAILRHHGHHGIRERIYTQVQLLLQCMIP